MTINPFMPSVLQKGHWRIAERGVWSGSIFNTESFIKHIKNKNYPDNHSIENEPVQIVKVEQSTPHKWVKYL